MPRAKVKLDLKTIDVPFGIPVDTGVTENLPVPANAGGQVSPFDREAFDFEKALDTYWGPLGDKFSQEQKDYFFMICKLRGLNPLLQQIHAQPRKRLVWDSTKGKKVPAVYTDGPMAGKEVYDLAVVVAYTSMISIAEEQPGYKGVKMQWIYRQPDGSMSEIIPPNPKDLVCIIATGFIEGIEPIRGQFFVSEFYLENSNWDKMLVHMMTKTVWMRILTLMYPHKFQGLYEESETNDNMVYHAPVVTKEEPVQRREQEKKAQMTTASPEYQRMRQQAPQGPLSQADLLRAQGAPVSMQAIEIKQCPTANPYTASPMDTLTQGSLPIPPAAAPKVETPAKETAPAVETQPVEEAPFMEKVIDFAQIMGTGDVPYFERLDIADYYSRPQHNLLCRLMKRHFINEKDRLKIYSAMLGKNPDGTPIEIEDMGVKLNYLTVHKAAEITDLYLKHEKNVEEFINNIVSAPVTGWGEENIKALGLKVTVVKRLLGYVASEHTRGPVKITAPDGTTKLQGGFQEFKNSMQAYGISFLKNEKVLATYREVEKEMEEKKAKGGN